MKIDADGGSSSVFSNAFCAARHHRIRLVDHHHATTSLERPVAGAIDDVAHLLDLDRAGLARLDQDDVRVHAARDPPARGAFAARIALELA